MKIGKTIIIYLRLLFFFGISFLSSFSVLAGTKPLKIEVNKSIKEPLPIAIPSFVSDIELNELTILN